MPFSGYEKVRINLADIGTLTSLYRVGERVAREHY